MLLLIVLVTVPSVLVHSTQYLLVIFARYLLEGNEKWCWACYTCP